jgi:translation initiation factor RLI1
MPKRVAAVDYSKCLPESCDSGECAAALACEHGALIQESPYEEPEINSAKWCDGCAHCAQACLLKAIRMI